jgi:CRP-like cAMP-binding protein
VGRESQNARSAVALFDRNDLLGAMLEHERLRWFSKLELVRLRAGEVLFEPGRAALTHAYFPVSSVLSVLWLTRSGASAQTAAVGNEGMFDISVCLGGEPMQARAIVQHAGLALRIPNLWLNDEFDRSVHLRRILLDHTKVLMAQTAQAVACNRRHTIDQQLCRWLLLSLDRTHASELTTTQELIAAMLGVRREGVNQAAGQLQRAGMIACRRGHIAVLDRDGLERRSCECYAQVSGEFQRLLGRDALSPEGGLDGPILRRRTQAA